MSVKFGTILRNYITEPYVELILKIIDHALFPGDFSYFLTSLHDNW